MFSILLFYFILSKKLLNDYCHKTEKVLKKEMRQLSRKSLVPKASPRKGVKKRNVLKMNPVNLEN